MIAPKFTVEQGEKLDDAVRLLGEIHRVATGYPRCCDQYQDSLGGMHCRTCGQKTFAMMHEIQQLLGVGKSCEPPATEEMSTTRIDGEELRELMAEQLTSDQYKKLVGTMELFMDGNAWCFKSRGIEIASPLCFVRFGDTPEEAIRGGK